MVQKTRRQQLSWVFLLLSIAYVGVFGTQNGFLRQYNNELMDRIQTLNEEVKTKDDLLQFLMKELKTKREETLFEKENETFLETKKELELLKKNEELQKKILSVRNELFAERALFKKQKESSQKQLSDLKKRLNDQEKEQASQDDLLQFLMKELKTKREKTAFKKENETLLEANKELVMNSAKKIKNEAYEKFIDKQFDEISSLRKQLSVVQKELFVDRESYKKHMSDLQKRLNDQEQERLSRLYTIDRASGSTPNHKIEINMKSQKENEDLQKKHEELQIAEYKYLESWNEEKCKQMKREANQKQIENLVLINEYKSKLREEILKTQKMFRYKSSLQKQLSEERESFQKQLFEEKELLQSRLNDQEKKRLKEIAEIKEKNKALAKTNKEFFLQKKESTEVFSKKSEVLSKDDTSIRYY